MSKSIIAAATAFVIALAGSALAEPSPKKEASPAQKAHRERMSACSKDAKQQGIKGDERKEFMRQCLSEGKTSATPQDDTERNRKAACRKEARDQGLKGAARKKFMNECVGAQ